MEKRSKQDQRIEKQTDKWRSLFRLIKEQRKKNGLENLKAEEAVYMRFYADIEEISLLYHEPRYSSVKKRDALRRIIKTLDRLNDDIDLLTQIGITDDEWWPLITYGKPLRNFSLAYKKSIGAALLRFGLDGQLPPGRREDGRFGATILMLSDIWSKHTGSRATVVNSNASSDKRVRTSPFVVFVDHFISFVDPDSNRKNLAASIEKVIRKKDWPADFVESENLIE